MNIFYKLACLLLALGTVSIASAADENIDAGVRSFYTFTLENDLFVGSDDGYTNGIGFTLGSGGFKNFDSTNTPKWLRWLIEDSYINTKPGKTRAISHMFFQRMQTPEDITISEFQPDDLPYAGMLAWQGTAFAWDDDVSDQLSLYLGWVGSGTLAEQSQSIIHKAIGSDDPKGWRHQLKNEPLIKVEAQRTWRLYRNTDKKYHYDVIGLGGIGIGNLESATKGGIAVRWGTNLAKSIGAFSLQADRFVNPLSFSNKKDFYLYAGARAGYVANDIFITGNTFTDSHSAELNHFQHEIAAGAVWSPGGNWAYVFALSSSSSRTKISTDREIYGAVGVTYRH